MCHYQKEIKGKVYNCKYYDSPLFKKGLPIDKEGLCILHSSDEAWKEKKDIYRYLTILMAESERKSEHKEISLDHIVFSQSVLKIFIVRKYVPHINFDGSTFLSKLKIEDVTFENGINFRNCTFHKSVTLENVHGARFEFSDSVYKGKMMMNNCSSISNFYMTNTNMDGSLTVTNTVFNQSAFFDGLKANLDKDVIGGCNFTNVTFVDFASFERTQFNKMCYFENIKVGFSLIFHETDFAYTEAVPVYSSANFVNFTTATNARIEFRGTPENRIFSKCHDVNFGIKDFDGQIFFENVDFTKLGKKIKDRLIQDAKGTDARVVIGSGCMKYYNQTPIKVIDISRDNQSLVSELCNTFAEYFKKSVGYNLGVEIVSRNEHEIRLYYFSDETIPYEDFERQLQLTEQKMWSLVKIDNQSIKSVKESESLPSKIIYATDTIVNLLGIILKIAARIPLLKITRDELANLLTTTSVSDIPSIDSDQFRALNVNQNIILGIGNSQSLKLDK